MQLSGQSNQLQNNNLINKQPTKEVFDLSGNFLNNVISVQNSVEIDYFKQLISIANEMKKKLNFSKGNIPHSMIIEQKKIKMPNLFRIQEEDSGCGKNSEEKPKADTLDKESNVVVSKSKYPIQEEKGSKRKERKSSEKHANLNNNLKGNPSPKTKGKNSSRNSKQNDLHTPIKVGKASKSKEKKQN